MKKLRKTPDMLNKYNALLMTQLDRDFIEKVTSNDINGILHYIPHHGVIKQSRTTPLRIVFDCSTRQ